MTRKPTIPPEATCCMVRALLDDWAGEAEEGRAGAVDMDDRIVDMDEDLNGKETLERPSYCAWTRM